MAQPGSVEWPVGKGVPREAAKQIADPGPSKFNPQPGTVDWLMERGVPRQAADAIAREPDPIRPDRYYWQRKKEILENPDMSLPMKEYLLGLLEDRYHTPMNKPSVVDETSGALAEYVTPTKFEIIEATIRKNGEVTQQDMEDLGIGTGMGASVAADMFNRQFTLASDYGLSFQDVVMQFALSQGDQGAAYMAYRFGQAGSSLIDRLLAGAPDQRLPDRPMNLVDKGKGGGDNGGGVGSSADKKPGTVTGPTERRSSKEIRIANDLAARGKNVRLRPESTVNGEKSYDADIDGNPTEFKTLENPNTGTAAKRILEGFRQNAKLIIVDARDCGLTKQQAIDTINRLAGKYPDKSIPGVVEIWTFEGIVTHP